MSVSKLFRKSTLKILGKIGLFVLGLFVFTLALTLLKEGAKELGPFVRNFLDVNNVANALGFGWLFAYAVMSGSPVAAITLTLLDANALNRLEAFAMINGSRLGASFIVLFIGFVYSLRGRERRASMSTGLLSLLVTQTTYLPALFLGGWLIHTGWLDDFQLTHATAVASVFDLIFDPIVNPLVAWLPRLVIFAMGFGTLMLSFTLIDKSLPEVHLEDTGFQGMARILYRPLFTFLLGAAVTTLTMSVSLSVSILVPLSVRGYVRRENIIPYVMGANITTFIDTLIAAVLLGNPGAFTVVLLEMLSVSVVSLIVIGVFYVRYERAILDITEGLLAKPTYLAIYMFGIVGIPILLMLL
jgi:solute carrier family 34 (sodium-dependent phosphate cotransporter)